MNRVAPLVSLKFSQRFFTKESPLYGVLAIAGASLISRFLVVYHFPTVPVSDFREFIQLAEAIRDTVWATGSPSWELRAAGLPSLLAALSWIIPVHMDTLARWATATITGILPLLPWMVLRDCVSMPVRLLSAALLAFWPDLILTSGVVSSDNWVLFPVVTSVVVATRSWILRRSSPILSAVLLALCTWIRPEMLLATMPFAAMACWADPVRRQRNLLIGCLSLMGLLSAIAAQRQAGSGQFKLAPNSSGFALLGTFMPGVYPETWRVPDYLLPCHESQQRPGENTDRLFRRLALDEFVRRPSYHAVRAFHSTVTSWRGIGGGTLYWSLRPDLLPLEARASAKKWLDWAEPFSWRWVLVIHVAALAAFGVAIVRRSPIMLAIAASIFLKVSMHAMMSVTPRYFVVPLAQELILISFAVGEMLVLGWKRSLQVALPCLLAALAMMGLLAKGVVVADSYLLANTEPLLECPP